MMYSILAVDGIISTLNQVRSGIVGSKLAAMSSLASVLAACMAAFVLLKIAHDYINGEGITLWGLLRPIVLLILVCQFNTFVASPIHGLCNMFTTSISRQANVSMLDFEKHLGDVWMASIKNGWRPVSEKIENMTASEVGTEGGDASALENNGKEKTSGWKKFWLKVKSVAAVPFRAMTTLANIELMTLGEVLLGLVLVIMKAVIFGQQVYCYVYLTLLTLLGPFVFAFGIVPSFRNTIPMWIERYIQISFWIPVGQLVVCISYYMLDTVIGVAETTYKFGTMWLGLVMAFVALLNVFAVPKIAGYVIESTGANDAHSSANNFAIKAAATVAKIL